MSLKRKASFPIIASSNVESFMTGPSLMMDDSPKHLGSRTRKRFRNDRPEDKVVYENTLRWLFSAQQQQESAAPSLDEHENMELESLPSSEIVDPRQQTLHKFFQLSQSAPFQSRSNQINRQPLHNSPSNDVFSQRRDFDIISTGTSISRDTTRASSQGAGAHIAMDTDSCSEESNQDIRRWVGGYGWMS
ncbi:uncharacterized protein ATNIH1004_006081 [Aspergillus tanneri]|uniref:Uncharacterized protein n=1 Tax=Aspergillus tanneri TaxID=1220188 RepID=A0A5M9MK53_9EURO|nr:uncharacterized protein ATNIH1004_006081 [Aspergillus tanneri]KAA8647388.1 hypothetical protein ATNIH1004_006081 [Aspergillus tanneri]